MCTVIRPRLLITAALVAGAGLLGASAQGVGSLDRELAAAADAAAEARYGHTSEGERDCPWRKRREALRETGTTF